MVRGHRALNQLVLTAHLVHGLPVDTFAPHDLPLLRLLLLRLGEDLLHDGPVLLVRDSGEPVIREGACKGIRGRRGRRKGVTGAVCRRRAGVRRGARGRLRAGWAAGGDNSRLPGRGGAGRTRRRRRARCLWLRRKLTGGLQRRRKRRGTRACRGGGRRRRLQRCGQGWHQRHEKILLRHGLLHRLRRRQGDDRRRLLQRLLLQGLLQGRLRCLRLLLHGTLRLGMRFSREELLLAELLLLLLLELLLQVQYLLLLLVLLLLLLQ